MSKRKAATRAHPKDAKAAIRDLLVSRGSISAGEAARSLGVTRQAAHYHLRRMVATGEIRMRGAGRATRYELRALFAKGYPLAGLAEDLVWEEVQRRLAGLTVAPNVQSIARYAFTEMLNNAIDHSAGTQADVIVWAEDPNISFSIKDDGIGVFHTVQTAFGFESEYESVRELSKGKRTMDPEHHSGEGIFFTSRVVDVFRLESHGIAWTVDNLLDDQSIGSTQDQQGTTVSFSIDRTSSRILREVFDRFSDPNTLEFTRNRASIRLYQSSRQFVSRSEAKRLAVNLEAFEEVELDFTDVAEVGQGFVDELFRVWAASHPRTRLVPVGMNPAVEFMVRRGMPSRP